MMGGMCDPLTTLLGCVLAVSSWIAPQPQYSAGRIYNYGGDSVALANVQWHWPGMTLEGYAGAGASISPAHLGDIMWARVEGGEWVGPILVADVTARNDAAAAVFVRGEIAELPRSIMAQLGAAWGVDGFIFFGSCPPPADSTHYHASPYAPPLAWEDAGSPGRSFWPYPPAEMPVSCP